MAAGRRRGMGPALGGVPQLARPRLPRPAGAAAQANKQRAVGGQSDHQRAAPHPAGGGPPLQATRQRQPGATQRPQHRKTARKPAAAETPGNQGGQNQGSKDHNGRHAPQTPVEPKPPLRSERPENASTRSKTGRTTGMNSSCAMRSPGRMVIGSPPGGLRFSALMRISSM